MSLEAFLGPLQPCPAQPILAQVQAYGPCPRLYNQPHLIHFLSFFPSFFILLPFHLFVSFPTCLLYLFVTFLLRHFLSFASFSFPVLPISIFSFKPFSSFYITVSVLLSSLRPLSLESYIFSPYRFVRDKIIICISLSFSLLAILLVNLFLLQFMSISSRYPEQCSSVQYLSKPSRLSGECFIPFSSLVKALSYPLNLFPSLKSNNNNNIPFSSRCSRNYLIPSAHLFFLLFKNYHSLEPFSCPPVNNVILFFSGHGIIFLHLSKTYHIPFNLSFSPL